MTIMEMRDEVKYTCRQLLLLVSILLQITACKKTVTVDAPVTFIIKAAAFANDAAALSAVYGIYGQLVTHDKLASGGLSISALMALSADEMQPAAGSLEPAYFQFYSNKVPTTTKYFWSELYTAIYACNAALEGIAASAGISAAVKKQLTGEVTCMRAFFYFYLVNLYGDVPLALNTDYRINNTLARSPAPLVYTQIIVDLENAKNLLGEDYLFNFVTTTSRLTVNKQVAEALLARVYLYTRDWKHAAENASLVIADAKYQLEPNPGNVFLKSSREAIWQLQMDNPEVNTYDARYFVLAAGMPPNGLNPGSINPLLLNAFESGDKRLQLWVGRDTVLSPAAIYYYPYKYKVTVLTTTITEMLTALRLAEQYLVRAEALAQMGNLAGAADDLNRIRNRAGLAATTAGSKTDLLASIAHERQVELFTEWGHRWFDLKRSGGIDTAMQTICNAKGTVWNSNAQLLPVPLADITLNPNLLQNPGY